MFRFKQFCIDDELSAMKIGTDSVLLGAWTNISPAKRILDVGTGCGILALMAAQRNNDAKITAIDIDKEAAKQAGINFRNSKWADSFEVINISLQDFAKDHEPTFDYVLCNPPFFQNSLLPPSSQKAVAKHNITLSYSDLFFYCRKVIMPKSTLAIIAPFDLREKIVGIGIENNFYCSREAIVKSSAKHQPHRIMMEFVNFEVAEVETETIEIYNSNDNSYTDRYKEICKDFYLKF